MDNKESKSRDFSRRVVKGVDGMTPHPQYPNLGDIVERDDRDVSGQSIREQIWKELPYCGNPQCLDHVDGKFSPDHLCQVCGSSIDRLLILFDQISPEQKQRFEFAIARADDWIDDNAHDLGEMGKFIRTEYAHNGIEEISLRWRSFKPERATDARD